MFITIWARSCQMSLFRHAMRRHVHVFLFGWTAIVLIGHDRANSDRTQIKRSLIQTFKSAKKIIDITIQVACSTCIRYHHLDYFVLSKGDIKATTNDLWPYCLVLQGRLYMFIFIQIFPPCPLRLLDFGIQRSDIMAYFTICISLIFKIKL